MHHVSRSSIRPTIRVASSCTTTFTCTARASSAKARSHASSKTTVSLLAYFFSSSVIADFNSKCCLFVNNHAVAQVHIRPKMVNFGLCIVGERLTRTFEIFNSYEIPLAFQLDANNEYSPFKLSVTCGTLRPFESQLVQVTFAPQHAIIYYKRFALLVQNHPSVLFVHMLATAHSELVKPPVINRRHMHLYQFLKRNKLASHTPQVYLPNSLSRCLSHLEFIIRNQQQQQQQQQQKAIGRSGQEQAFGIAERCDHGVRCVRGRDNRAGRQVNNTTSARRRRGHR